MAEEFEGRELKGAGFWGVDLTGARFREANLEGVRAAWGAPHEAWASTAERARALREEQLHHALRDLALPE